MLEEAKRHLEKKAKQLDFGRAKALADIQAILDGRYPQMTQAKSINEGVLKVLVESSAVASELRLNQVEILKLANKKQAYLIERIYIQTGSFK